MSATILNLPALALASIAAMYLASGGLQSKAPLNPAYGSSGTIPTTIPNRPAAAAAASRTVAQCQAKYCPHEAVQILIDRPVNTLNRDDRKGGATLMGAYNYTKSQFYQEAANSPGVNAVAQMVY